MDLRDVVNLLVAMNLMFAALIGHDPMPERGADHLGNDPVEAYWAPAEPQSVDGTAPAVDRLAGFRKRTVPPRLQNRSRQ
jgi:hypothetical protein